MKNDLIIKLFWASILRWIAIFFQSALLLLGVKLGYVATENIPPYLLVVFLLILSNINKLNGLIPISSRLSFLLSWDTISFTYLIFLSGKMENPFWPLIYLHTGMAAILLPKKHEYYYLPVILLSMFSIHYASYSYHSALFYVLVPQWIIMLATWFLTRTLGNLLIHQREKLSILERQNQKIQKMKSIGALSAGILHEIGTPLNTLRLKLDKIQKFEQDSNLNVMDLALSQCETIIEKLNTAQQEMATRTITNENLKNLIEEHYDGSVKIYNSLHFNFAIPNEIIVKAAKTNLTLILDIIYENAKESGASEISLSTKASKNGDSLMSLVIDDNGPGFDSFILENIGAPYTSTKGRGRGLGLYTVYISMESMGGELKISNTEHGARLELILQKDNE